LEQSATPGTASTFLPADDYALGETLTSGQAFRWTERDGGWEGIIDGRWVRLISERTGIRAEVMAGEQSDWKWLANYLQTTVDLRAILNSFPRDEPMHRAVRECHGLRLLKQDPWECLASFILSSTKQIVQIRQIVELLCERFGDPVRVPEGRKAAHAFPSPERLAALSEDDLRCCKMGFRAPYLRGSAGMVARGEVSLASIASMIVEEAREQLLRLPGVGRKIADCVLLFAYGFQEAFPVDVWVLKALRSLYFPKRNPSPKRLLKFTQTYFGPNAGYAQQYLFHYMRTRVGRENK
jgi:N-glycosylase/DNA lyase